MVSEDIQDSQLDLPTRDGEKMMKIELLKESEKLRRHKSEVSIFQ